MKTIFQALLLAAAPVALSAAAVAPAQAQSKLGIAVVDLDAAAQNSTAFTTAMQQMQVTYKATIDSLNTRQTALQTQLKAKEDALKAAAQAAGGKSTPALQAQYEDLQKSAQAAQAELQRLGQPVARAQAYVKEQIAAKLDTALKQAMTKNKVDLALNPEATVAVGAGVDISAAVTAELNALLPSVSIAPPANWQPGQAQQGAAPAAGAAPAGR